VKPFESLRYEGSPANRGHFVSLLPSMALVVLEPAVTHRSYSKSM
jgi:hypothetical protein